MVCRGYFAGIYKIVVLLIWGIELFKRIKILKLLFFIGILFSVLMGITISRLVLSESLLTVNYFNDFLGYFLIWNILLYILDFFDIQNLKNKDFYLKRILIVTFFSFIISLFIRYLEHGQLTNWRVNLFKNIFVYSILGVLTLILTFLINKLKSKNLLVVGGRFGGRATAREILYNKDLKLNLVGFLSNSSSENMIIYEGDEVKENNKKIKGRIPNLGNEYNLLNVVKQKNIDYVIICKDRNLSADIFEDIGKLREMGARVYFIDEIFEALSSKLPIFHLSEDHYYYLFREIQKRENNKGLYYFLNKILNKVLGLIGLLISIPFILVAIVVIKIEDSGPAFFVQKRIGKDGRIFKIIKLRSMREHDPDKFPKNPQTNGDPRITKSGQIMRKLRIDELPQFINIVRGDMNLVGPRPEQVELVDKYSDEIPFYKKRHLIKPGVTGWAQINYDYGSDTEDTIYKLQYDLYYIKNRNFFLDCKIILKTLKIILSGEGV